jgi:hypothetical protein
MLSAIEDRAAYERFRHPDQAANTDPDNQCPICNARGFERCPTTGTVIECGHCHGSGLKTLIINQ